MVRGQHVNGVYEPEPSMHPLEEFLGSIIAAMPCAACGEPLGGSFIQCHRAKFHPTCLEKLRA